MATMAENIIAAGFETRPLMLEKGMYDSWKTRILLYIRGKEKGEMLINSIENGPYQILPEITIKADDGIFTHVDILNVNKSCVDECNKCLELETELLKKKDLIEKDVYDKLLKSYSTLEKHCISLELTTQLNQEIFQKDTFCEKQNALTFNQLFEINELKAQSQEKDTIIRKLKDRIKSLSGKDSVENVKKDIDEIETINIENTRVQSNEHCASLIAKINEKSVENSDLNAQLQEKVFAIEALKNELRKLKGKNVVDTVISKSSATIAPGMFKLDIEPISHKLKNNRDAHKVYLEKTIENIDTLRGLTCPSLTKPIKKLVAVTPVNKDKKVRFVEPIISSSNITKHTDSLRTKDSNKPLLTSTGVNTTTSASGSKSSGNTKKNRISRPPSSNQKNKVEEHPRNVKSSLNKKNSISEPISKAIVKHFVRNAKFESMCAICNKRLFDANHDMCLVDYVNDVNACSKSKSKRNKMRKYSQTNQETLSPVIPLGVEEADHDIEVAHMDNTLYVDFLIPKPSSEESSS
ncbi:hypothetical protein Tco_0495751 [Tanacetum coccineum]